MASGVEELLDMLFEMVDDAKNAPLPAGGRGGDGGRGRPEAGTGLLNLVVRLVPREIVDDVTRRMSEMEGKEG